MAELAPSIKDVNELHQSTCDLVSEATHNSIHSLKMSHKCHAIKTDIMVFDEDDGWLSDQDSSSYHNGNKKHVLPCTYTYT